MFPKHRSEHGAVTVFLIVIFAFVFAFVAIFIDFARMSALQNNTEKMAHAASRSVLSAFDQSLVKEYGLFAFGETDGNYIMSKVLEDQVDLTMRSDGLPLLQAKPSSSSVELLLPLGTYAVFEQQIREEMKYKAPIDFTIEIMNRFKPVAQVMKEASGTVDLLGKLQKLYDQREAKLDLLLEKQRQAANTVSPLSPLVPRSATSYISDQSIGGSVTNAEDIAAGISDYQQKAAEDQARDVLDRMYTEQLYSFQEGVSDVMQEFGQSQDTAKQKHPALMKEAQTLLDEIKQINRQMEELIKQSEQRPQQAGYNQTAAAPGTNGTVTQAVGSEEIAKIREQSRKLLLPDTLLGDFETDLNQQTSKFEAALRQAGTLSSTVGSSLSASGSSSGSLKSAVNTTARLVDEYMKSYVDQGGENVITQNAKQLEAYRSYDKERKQVEQQAGAKLKEAASLLGQLSNLKGKFTQAQQQYDLLHTYFNENRAFNSGGSAGGGTEQHTGNGTGEGAAASSSDPYEAGGASMTGMDSLYAGLSELVKGMSDRCFQTEYTANYFDAFDISTLDELLAGKGTAKLEAIADQFAPEHQEVEYILFGFHDPVSNIAAAYGEIFATRLAIRTMEGLIKNTTKGHPLLILAAALLYGIEHAIVDMLTLAKEGSIELSDYLKVELTYRDHLRLFLLLHGQSDKRLSRMLAVIRRNTGTNPDERATYVKGETTISMPLWFLPGVARAIGYAGGLKGKVEGSRYYVTKQADFSY